MSGVSSIAQYHITMRDYRHIKQRYFPKNPAMQRIIDQQVDASHSAPLVLVKKKTGLRRLSSTKCEVDSHRIPPLRIITFSNGLGTRNLFLPSIYAMSIGKYTAVALQHCIHCPRPRPISVAGQALRLALYSCNFSACFE